MLAITASDSPPPFFILEFSSVKILKENANLKNKILP